MANKRHITHVNMTINLDGDESKLLDNLLTLNKGSNKTRKELMEFIFKIGLSFVQGSFIGLNAAQFFSIKNKEDIL